LKPHSSGNDGKPKIFITRVYQPERACTIAPLSGNETVNINQFPSTIIRK